MTPGARIAAAEECLDAVLSGQSAERVLTSWGRNHRFAGSKDRAAIRDLVFDALRNLGLYQAVGGKTGRGITVAQAALTGRLGDFDGTTHAPPTPQPSEYEGTPSDADRWNLPDWLITRFRESLGDEAEPVAKALCARAPVYLRLNSPDAVTALAQDGIATEPHPTVPTAVQVTEGERKIAQSRAYRDGLVELQDAASQAVCLAVPLEAGQRVLDYCAGGGGKALALAARMPLTIDVHDADPRRMADIPARAKRAGVALTARVDPPYDVVVCDVPCSGSGTWRRAPEAKWRLSEADLAALLETQADILDRASRLTKKGGRIAYMTCSVLAQENNDQVTSFLTRNTGWMLERQDQHLPGSAGDGLFLAVLKSA